MRTGGRLAAALTGLGFTLACGGAGGGIPAGGAGYSCEAQGVYAVCKGRNGMERCQEEVARGMGVEVNEGDAQVAAHGMCTEHMTSQIIIAGYPTGSPDLTSRGEIRRSCQITSCVQVR